MDFALPPCFITGTFPCTSRSITRLARHFSRRSLTSLSRLSVRQSTGLSNSPQYHMKSSLCSFTCCPAESTSRESGTKYAGPGGSFSLKITSQTASRTSFSPWHVLSVTRGTLTVVWSGFAELRICMSDPVSSSTEVALSFSAVRASYSAPAVAPWAIFQTGPTGFVPTSLYLCR